MQSAGAQSRTPKWTKYGHRALCWKGCWKGLPALEGLSEVGGSSTKRGGVVRALKGGIQALEGGFQRACSLGSSAEKGSSTHVQGFRLHRMAASFIYQVLFLPQATLVILPSLFLADRIGSEEAEVPPKVQISVKDVVAKPNIVMREIGGRWTPQR